MVPSIDLETVHPGLVLYIPNYRSCYTVILLVLHRPLLTCSNEFALSKDAKSKTGDITSMRQSMFTPKPRLYSASGDRRTYAEDAIGL